MKQHVTVQLDSEVIHKAKVLAAQRSTSLSRLLADELARIVGDEERYQAAQRTAFAHLDAGFDLGGGPLPPREELHER